MLKTEDLIAGKYYRFDYDDSFGIGICLKNGSKCCKPIIYSSKSYYSINTPCVNKITEADKKEIHWLNEAKKANKFIPYEEAMKTFKAEEQIPEYVECIKWDGNYCEVGEIYPITKYDSDIKYCEIKLLHYKDAVLCNFGEFKFSTKEAYDLQNSKTNTQYKIGKWYTHPKWSPNSFIKFSSIRDYNSVYELERISQGNYKGVNTNWSISYEHTLEEADMNIVSNFLPKNHPDKIKISSTMNNCEYKIGDWVKIIQDGNGINSISQVYLNKIGKFIQKTDEEHPFIVRVPEHGNIHCFKIIPATLQEIKSIVHTLTDEEILEICKQFYPKGTEFICLNSNQNAIITTGYLGFGGLSIINELNEKKGLMTTNGYYHCLYANKHFAKIISSPIQEKKKHLLFLKNGIVKELKKILKFLTNGQMLNLIQTLFVKKGEGCIYSNKVYCGANLEDYGKEYTEITFEQFKQYVLKESQTTKQVKMVDCVSPTEVNTNITVKKAVKSTSNISFNVKPINTNIRVQINEPKYQAKKVIISKTTIKI